MSDHPPSSPSDAAPTNGVDVEGQAPPSPGEGALSPSSHSVPLTRTVAMIKTHALHHRFDIETRISEAGFEVLKERQMEFDTDTDPETLYELFGEDAESFREGPVWVYVLERRRAVEMLQGLMGPPVPEIARQNAPNSLRALYGIDAQQNAIMGSSDDETAEIQIASLFASSPPFPTTELPDVDKNGTINSLSSSVLSALRGANASATGTSEQSRSSTNANGKPLFRARPIPATIDKPDIVPRTTRAAALRAGIAVEKDNGPSKPRAPVSKEREAQMFADVPGYGYRSEKFKVASTAAPKVAPRMSRAAALRMGLKPEESPSRAKPRPSSFAAPVNVTKLAPKTGTFDGVPGHKRRETITVASVKAPTVAPRLNKAASLRAQKEAAPPSSFNFRGSSQAPSSRSSSRASIGGPRPSTSSGGNYIARPASVSRTASQTSTTSGTSSLDGHKRAISSAATSTSTVDKPKPKPRPSSLQAPTMAPRQNKAALLRAAKMEAEAAKNKAKPGPRAVWA
ncbi:hypothetical protein PUNSTDRAFT_97596 [Punctularia strigosozonata HHB-11173 SS5]|uniref:uncharacterized protein n=1 Tax=Punctularia strigosozonata (strain HHB-11173) TaxID=741275 RepID=UPI0004418437|nr:uncharacterized protein PUNSTDRAFT_97596 [Punctularia strigosozonata HHB-11173 SS5]EIN12745.1 hypothetical protein PUNSTDRAFT_97596 [Punctularia strigosozonata HHB-11173 SS5]